MVVRSIRNLEDPGGWNYIANVIPMSRQFTYTIAVDRLCLAIPTHVGKTETSLGSEDIQPTSVVIAIVEAPKCFFIF